MEKKINITRRILRFISGLVFCVALCCVCAESDEMGPQIIWTLSWGAVLVLSGKAFVSLH